MSVCYSNCNCCSELAQLRADLATSEKAAEGLANGLFTCDELLQAERAAHAETRKALEALNADYGTLLRESNAHEIALESTRAELAKAEARAKELEAEMFTMKPDLGYDDEQQ